MKSADWHILSGLNLSKSLLVYFSLKSHAYITFCEILNKTIKIFFIKCYLLHQDYVNRVVLSFCRFRPCVQMCSGAFGEAASVETRQFKPSGNAVAPQVVYTQTHTLSEKKYYHAKKLPMTP